MVQTGHSAGGDSGTLSLLSGDAEGEAGGVVVSVGTGAGPTAAAGGVSLFGGAATQTGGTVLLQGGTGSTSCHIEARTPASPSATSGSLSLTSG